MNNENRRRVALLVLRSRLRLEISTGMTFSGGSTVSAARNWGYDGNRTKKKCLEWVEAELFTMGVVV